MSLEERRKKSRSEKLKINRNLRRERVFANPSEPIQEHHKGSNSILSGEECSQLDQYKDSFQPSDRVR